MTLLRPFCDKQNLSLLQNATLEPSKVYSADFFCKIYAGQSKLELQEPSNNSNKCLSSVRYLNISPMVTALTPPHLGPR